MTGPPPHGEPDRPPFLPPEPDPAGPWDTDPAGPWDPGPDYGRVAPPGSRVHPIRSPWPSATPRCSGRVT